MDKNTLNKLVAMYLIAIGNEGAPNSHVWMALDPQMADLATHQTILGALKAQDIVKESGYFLTLTEKGKALHQKIVELYQPKK